MAVRASGCAQLLFETDVSAQERRLPKTIGSAQEGPLGVSFFVFLLLFFFFFFFTFIFFFPQRARYEPQSDT
jgi:hypothetical protein